MSTKILVVDDEPDVVEMVAFNLRNAGFKVMAANDGEEALAKARMELPGLIILDLMLPKLSGTEVCKLLKREASTAAIPIIMLTAKTDEMDRILGLELGADDYVTKPFSPRELGLRVQSVLRRQQAETAKNVRYRHGDLVLDHSRHEVLVGGEKIVLTATEFKLLALLLERKGRVQTRDRLLNEVWGYENTVDTRTVDTHVRRLREKLGRVADYVETVRGVGYRMLEAV